MQGFSRPEKILMGVAASVLLLSVYFLGSGKLWEEKPLRREMPVGKVSLSRGDTRWKGESQVYHFKTWQGQRLYIGDTLYAGVASRLGFFMGEIYVDLKPHTRVTLKPVEEKLSLAATFGELEIHLPPAARMRLNGQTSFLDIASVNGGRMRAWVEGGGKIKVQNIAGDLVVRTEGKTEYTVPEKAFFSAGLPLIRAPF